MTRPATRTVHHVDFRTPVVPRPTVALAGRVPRVAQLLGLAHTIERMVNDGELRDLADAARVLGMTRARISQITNLLLLAPVIQEAILKLPLVTTGRDPITERQLRAIVAEPDWGGQMELWNKVRGLK